MFVVNHGTIIGKADIGDVPGRFINVNVHSSSEGLVHKTFEFGRLRLPSGADIKVILAESLEDAKLLPGYRGAEEDTVSFVHEAKLVDNRSAWSFGTKRGCLTMDELTDATDEILRDACGGVLPEMGFY